MNTYKYTGDCRQPDLLPLLLGPVERREVVEDRQRRLHAQHVLLGHARRQPVDEHLAVLRDRKQAFIYIYIYIYIHIYIYMFTYICMYVCIHTHAYTHTHIYIHTHISTHTHTHIYLYIYIYSERRSRSSSVTHDASQ